VRLAARLFIVRRWCFGVAVVDVNTKEVVHRRPCGSLQQAQDYCAKIKEDYASAEIEIRSLPIGQWPQ
jgi:hypothetical protein